MYVEYFLDSNTEEVEVYYKIDRYLLYLIFNSTVQNLPSIDITYNHCFNYQNEGITFFIFDLRFWI